MVFSSLKQRARSSPYRSRLAVCPGEPVSLPNRETFGKPIWQHQSVGNYLADMSIKLIAARQLLLYAARSYDSDARSDMEAGMAKLFCSETAKAPTRSNATSSPGNSSRAARGDQLSPPRRPCAARSAETGGVVGKTPTAY